MLKLKVASSFFLFLFLQITACDLVLSNQMPILLESIQFSEEITFCDIKIPLDDQSIRERLEKEVLLALWDRAQVILWIKRSSRYFPHIKTLLKENNVHEDFKYLPVVESGLRPHSSSSKGAVGYWQFIHGTGEKYGLRIDSKIDERRNIFKSTLAACKYINKLQKQFGSPLLAIAAYNMGEYGLASEIKLQETSDFFSLYLPLQTQQYLFKLIAVKLIMENPEKYGFHFGPNDYYPLFVYDEVNFNSPEEIPITLIAKTAKVPFKTIKDMNPDIRGYYLSAGKINVLIPKGAATGFKESFDKLFSEYQKEHITRFHIVQKGDSLIGIARKYHIPLASLLKWNGLNAKSVVHPGNRLVVSDKK